VGHTAYRVNSGNWQSYTLPITVTTQGTTTVGYYSVDVAGNTDTVQTATVRIDLTSPASVANAPTSASNSPITVTWVATDTLSGVSSVALWYKFGIDGTWADSGLPPQSGNSGTFHFVPGGNGTYCFTTRATDLAGNTEPEPTRAGDACCEYVSGNYINLPLVMRSD